MAFHLMNKIRAKQLEKQLAGHSVAGWTIDELINSGKSAVVFKAHNSDGKAAVKVFDPELIEKHGAEIQTERIEREKSLIDKSHPHLVKILGGGFWEEQQLYFVIMEHLPWKNLTEVLPEVPVGAERRIISQIASAAHFLEGLSICHRDIKPENIAISSDFQHATLLDLGVIRPHGTKPLTDGTGGKIFVGTLKYSPPEFLLRTDDGTPDSWRAITYYQLGGVLHDLIMRRSLFTDFENPFARLVNAVQDETPRIESKTVSPSLVDLARYCLLKPAQTRLQLVTWEDFEEEQPAVDDIENIKSQILRRNLATQSEKGHKRSVADPQLLDQKLDGYSEDLQSACRIACIDDPTVFPPVEIRELRRMTGLRHFFAQFEPSSTHCLSRFLRLEVIVKWVDADSDVCEVLSGTTATTSALEPRKSQVECSTPIFKGIYAPDTARRGIISALYRAVNATQQLPEVAHE